MDRKTNMNVNQEILDIIEKVLMSRPEPIRKYDQIYMKANDMLNQAFFMRNMLSERKVVFLGDGDAMSIFFLLLMKREIIPYAAQLAVLDFDERIIRNYNNFFSCNNHNIQLSAELYNVINPIDERKKGMYDFFYINPPYGSYNKGKSVIAWLYRCMELCTNNCDGCIILPYMKSVNWTVDNYEVVENFLLKNGFVITHILSDMHRYHLPDNPELSSSTIIVHRMREVKSAYEDNILPEEVIKNFYGSARRLPEYIKDDGTLYGMEKFDWIYGDKAY